MLFLVDAQLPPLLARRLTEHGHRSVHVTAALPATALDKMVAALANDMDALLISKDADFVEIRRRGELRHTLVWVRCGNAEREKICSLIVSRLDDIAAAHQAADFAIEIR